MNYQEKINFLNEHCSDVLITATIHYEKDETNIDLEGSLDFVVDSVRFIVTEEAPKTPVKKCAQCKVVLPDPDLDFCDNVCEERYNDSPQYFRNFD